MLGWLILARLVASARNRSTKFVSLSSSGRSDFIATSRCNTVSNAAGPADAALAEQFADLVLVDRLRHRGSGLELGLWSLPPIGSWMRRVVGSTRFGAGTGGDAEDAERGVVVAAGGQRRFDQGIAGFLRRQARGDFGDLARQGPCC